MILIVGLGNPGTAYEHTPHNIGREVIEQLAVKAGFTHPAFEKRFNALVSLGEAGEEKVLAALPETFMNNSGEAVAAIAAFYKIPSEHIWVTHDDADLPFGNIRVSRDATSAGHRGVESVIEKLGTKDFWRFRIGIRPEKSAEIPLEAYVLKKDALPKAEREMIIKKAVTLLETVITQGIETAEIHSD